MAKPDRSSRTEKQPRRNAGSYKLEFLNPAQKIAWATIDKHDVVFLIGPAGTGKTQLATAYAISKLLAGDIRKIFITRPIVEAEEKLGFLPGPQPLDAGVLTPFGWKTMGEIVPGDEVIGSNGKSQKVLRVFPKGEKEIYKVVTTDGTTTECCAEHLWMTTTAEDRKYSRVGSVKSTRQIMESMVDSSGGVNHHLPRNNPVEFAGSELPLSAYALGAILGDGCAIDSVCIAITEKDRDIFVRLEKEFREIGCSLVRNGQGIGFNVRGNVVSKKPSRRVVLSNSHSSVIYSSLEQASIVTGVKKGTLKSRCTNRSTVDGITHDFKPPLERWTNPIKNILADLGLLGKKAADKFVPDSYKFATVQDRIDLLRGLMDTDGCVKANGEASFCSVSKRLSEDVAEVVRSLGGRATVRERPARSATFRDGRIIAGRGVSYEFTISMRQNPFHMSRKAERHRQSYIHGVAVKEIIPVGRKEAKCIMVDNDDHLYLTDNYIVTHNTFEEKVHPYMLPIFDCIETCVGKDTAAAEKIKSCLEVAPLAYMRGRAQPLDAKVLTPAGFVNMGDIQLGDMVTGPDGKATAVTGVFPQGEKDVYRLRFSDGTYVESCKEHLWMTKTLSEKRHGKDYSPKRLDEIMGQIVNQHGQKIHRIPTTAPVEIRSTTAVPFDPYLLGVLLGDGNFTTKYHLAVSCSDQSLLKRLSGRLPEGHSLSTRNGKDFYFRCRRPSGLKQYLKECGLWGKYSYEKFIPECWLHQSVDFRIELLRGMADTDGCCTKHRSGNSRTQYYSTSEVLAEAFRWLVFSLGGTATIRKREHDACDTHVYNGHEIRHCRPSYVVDFAVKDFNPFGCERKSQKYTVQKPVRLLSSVEHVGVKPCQCISVEADHHQYITDNFVVTHNTLQNAVCILDEAQNCTRGQLKLFLTRLGTHSKMIVTGDPRQSDLKGGVNGLMDMVDDLEDVEGIGIVDLKSDAIVRHPLVGRIIDKLERDNGSSNF